ncbi:MAG: hypothetical protein ACE5IK_09920 [Acidobacteriota bacterium]
MTTLTTTISWMSVFWSVSMESLMRPDRSYRVGRRAVGGDGADGVAIAVMGQGGLPAALADRHHLAVEVEVLLDDLVMGRVGRRRGGRVDGCAGQPIRESRAPERAVHLVVLLERHTTGSGHRLHQVAVVVMERVGRS